jgi:hypothetical protein
MEPAGTERHRRAAGQGDERGSESSILSHALVAMSEHGTKLKYVQMNINGPGGTTSVSSQNNGTRQSASLPASESLPFLALSGRLFPDEGNHDPLDPELAGGP